MFCYIQCNFDIPNSMFCYIQGYIICYRIIVKNEANRNLYVDHHQVSVGDVISPVAEGIEGRRELFLVDVA